MPNGMCLVWGPWHTTEHDATMFRETGFLDDMHEACQELGTYYCVFRDSAYSLHGYMYRILKAPPEGSLTQMEQCFNALMVQFASSLIIIENC